MQGRSRGRRFATDRVPTIEEIRKIIKYPDSDMAGTSTDDCFDVFSNICNIDNDLSAFYTMSSVKE